MENFKKFVKGLDTEGHRKVFISTVHAAAVKNGLEVSLEEFKGWLLEQMTEGRVVLSRCDLPYAFDQDTVKASTTHHINATFHCIRTDR